MDSSDSHSVVLQTVQNAYVGTHMLSVMAETQHKSETYKACIRAQEQCKTVLTEYEEHGTFGFDMEKAIALLNHVSRLARDLWNIQLTGSLEKINLRIVNDIADAERCVYGQPDDEPVACPAPLEKLIGQLEHERQSDAGTGSPYQVMLAKNEHAVIKAGMQAADSMMSWASTIKTNAHDDKKNNHATKKENFAWEPLITEPNPERTCDRVALPDNPKGFATIKEFEAWLSAIDEAGGLPDFRLQETVLEACTNTPGKYRQHAERMAESWHKQIANLPQDWTAEAANLFVHSACSIDLDTLNDEAIDLVKASVASAKKRSLEKMVCNGLNDEDHAEFAQSLEERRQQLIEELESLDELIDQGGTSKILSPGQS